MVLRMLANVLPRQSVSSAISLSMRSDGFIGSLCLELWSRFMRPTDRPPNAPWEVTSGDARAGVSLHAHFGYQAARPSRCGCRPTPACETIGARVHVWVRAC